MRVEFVEEERFDGEREVSALLNAGGRIYQGDFHHTTRAGALIALLFWIVRDKTWQRLKDWWRYGWRPSHH